MHLRKQKEAELEAELHEGRLRPNSFGWGLQATAWLFAGWLRRLLECCITPLSHCSCLYVQEQRHALQCQLRFFPLEYPLACALFIFRFPTSLSVYSGEHACGRISVCIGIAVCFAPLLSF
mmetsp:Transcript_41204/g.81250  ORF Transcript_41204/g.81250 Transcript_41204/m.81250 type:complete len:121 (+) Transcript_41204:323-685(+)